VNRVFEFSCSCNITVELGQMSAVGITTDLDRYRTVSSTKLHLHSVRLCNRIMPVDPRRGAERERQEEDPK